MFTEDYVQAVVEGADLSATVDALLYEAEVPVPNPGNSAKPIAPGRPQMRNPGLIRKALPYAVGGALIAQQALGKDTAAKRAFKGFRQDQGNFGSKAGSAFAGAMLPGSVQ